MPGIVTFEQKPEYGLVAVSGEVDLSWSSKVRDEVLKGLKNCDRVMVDLHDVSYIDSSGIAALVEGLQKAKAKSKQFALVNIHQSVQAVLELARLDQVFSVYPDIDSALADTP